MFSSASFLPPAGSDLESILKCNENQNSNAAATSIQNVYYNRLSGLSRDISHKNFLDKQFQALFACEVLGTITIKTIKDKVKRACQ